MIQTITKDGKVMCVTTVPYHPDTVKSMKKAGYKVMETDSVQIDQLRCPSLMA